MSFQFNKAMSGLNAALADSKVLHNYIIPGLDSYLLGVSDNLTVRLFHMTRDQEAFVAPHSHRYGFSCFVIDGLVENTIYTPCPESSANAQEYLEVEQRYVGAPGKYINVSNERAFYCKRTDKYEKKHWYSMDSSQVHSIVFSKGARVLFLEGPSSIDHSTTLQPHSNGVSCDLVRIEPWMFIKGASHD